MKKSLIYKLFVFVYVFALITILVLPSVKYRFSNVEITAISLPLMAIIVMSGKRYRLTLIQIAVCFFSMGFLHFIFNARGNTSSLMNLMITFYLCILPFFIGRFLLDMGDYKVIKWVTVATSIMLIFVMFKTFSAMSVDPTIARQLAYGDISDNYINAFRMDNVGGFGFSYCMGFMAPYITTYIDRTDWKGKYVVITCVVILFIFGIYTQYTTLLLLSIIFIYYVLIVLGKPSLKKIIVLVTLLALIIFFRPIVLFIASKIPFTALSSHFYDIYYMLGAEGDTGRTMMYESTLRVFMQNPIFGADLTNSSNLYIVNHSHSTFFGRLAEGGLLGVILNYGMLYMMFKSYIQVIDNKYIKPTFIFLLVLSILNPITSPEIFISSFMLIPMMEYLFVNKEENYGIKERLAY